MENKRSKKPLILGLSAIILAALAAAAFTAPQKTATKVEEQLGSENFLK